MSITHGSRGDTQDWTEFTDTYREVRHYYNYLFAEQMMVERVAQGLPVATMRDSETGKLVAI